jgi:hypothetical protein
LSGVFKPGENTGYYENYLNSFLLFLLIWIGISFSFEKYSLLEHSDWLIAIRKTFVVNLVIFFVITTMMYLFQSFNYSRFIVLGTVRATLQSFLSIIVLMVSSTQVRMKTVPAKW